MKRANAQKSFISVQSRDSSKAQSRGPVVKARMNVSGDRSLDMFASEFNSAGGNQTTHMNLMDDSTSGVARKNLPGSRGDVKSAMQSRLKSTPSKGLHAHK